MELAKKNVPTYTYTCTACNDVIEKRQSFSDAPLTTCEQCGGALRKVIHPVGIVFKGSGWYITDSRSASSPTNGKSPETRTEKTEKPDKTGKSEKGDKADTSASKASAPAATDGTKAESKPTT
jgi:putative FmdB family regulatory protein